MKWRLVAFVYLLPLVTLAQHRITGRVLSNSDKHPVPKATVFLSNATNGTATDEEGSFTLNNVKPGQYDLLVTSVGYEAYHKTIMVSGNISTGDVLLSPKNTELQMVTIKADPNRGHYLAEFLREFIGTSAFAEQCKIRNTDVLDFDYDKKKHQLTASSDSYLDIENKALGYRIKYYLHDFIKNRDSNFVYYAGYSVFENLPGTEHQLKKWAKNRRNVYYGSPEHFLRSCIANQAEEEGFKVLKLIVQSNPKRKPDSLIRANIMHYSSLDNNDSIRYWNEQLNIPKEIQYLIKTPLNISEFVRRTNQTNVFAFGFNEHLYVMYTKKHYDSGIAPSYHPPDAPDYLTTVINLKKTYILFDRNGVVMNPYDMYYDGFWGKNRIAELLPVDYEPEQ